MSESDGCNVSKDPVLLIRKKFRTIDHFIGSIYSGTRKTAICLLGAAMASKSQLSTRNRVIVNVENSMKSCFTKKDMEVFKEEITRLARENFLIAKVPKRSERCNRCRFASRERGFKLSKTGKEELLKIIKEIQPK